MDPMGMSFGGAPVVPRGRGDARQYESFRDNTEEYRQQLQNKLPFAQESVRGGGSSAPLDMLGPSNLATMASVQTSVGSEEEQRERVARAAKALESRFRSEVDACERKMQRQMMYMGAAVAVVLALAMWRFSHK